MSIPSYIAKQSRKPSGFFGKKIMTRIMDKANKGMNEETFKHLNVSTGDMVLDIGFGSGVLVKKIAEETDAGKIVGIDLSQDMVDVATESNRQHILQNRVSLTQADVSHIPFDNDTFDKVYTANTIYFWPDPIQNLAEIYRILKPGSMLLVAFRTKEQMEKVPVTRHNFALYTQNEVERLLSEACFTDIQTHHYPHKRLDTYCTVALKPKNVS